MRIFSIVVFFFFLGSVPNGAGDATTEREPTFDLYMIFESLACAFDKCLEHSANSLQNVFTALQNRICTAIKDLRCLMNNKTICRNHSQSICLNKNDLFSVHFWSGFTAKEREREKGKSYAKPMWHFDMIAG